MTIKSLEEMLLPGNKLKIDYGPDNPNTLVIHIRALIDCQYIVYRYWSRAKQNWRYRVEWVYMFELWFEDGRLKYHGISKDVVSINEPIQFVKSESPLIENPSFVTSREGWPRNEMQLNPTPN